MPTLTPTLDYCSHKCFSTNTDYQGNDLVKGGIKASSAKACCAACAKTAGCKFWTFGTDKNTCWVKDSAAGWQTQSHRISGQRVLNSKGMCATKSDFPVGACQSKNFEPGIDYQGSDLVKAE